MERGRVVEANFNDYVMIPMKEAPPIEEHLLMSDERPTGIGETTVPVIAPAIWNAIFTSTGMRLRRLPIRAQDLA